MKEKWLLCPVCGNKTRLKIRADTVLKNFLLFCPKCKHETIISVKQLNMSVIREPDASGRSYRTAQGYRPTEMGGLNECGQGTGGGNHLCRNYL